MRFRCLLCAVSDTDVPTVIALSADDDCWFVSPAGFTPEIAEMAADTEKSGKVTVLGALFTSGEDR